MEFFRPHEHLRPSQERGGEIILEQAHPTEVRCYQVYKDYIRLYFSDPTVAEAIRREMATPLPVDMQVPWIDELRLAEVKVQTLARDIELKRSAYKAYDRLPRPSFVRSEAKQERVQTALYSPSFQEALNSGYLIAAEPHPLVPLSLDEAFDIRYRGLMTLSRSARGEHTPETTNKRLRVYGEELSRDTVEAHLQVNEILRDHLHQIFNTPRDL